MAGREKKPLISVIVPVYGVEAYLPKCLDSLLAQTWQNFELILVDDGSPDGSWNIMRDYAARDSRVRIFKKENGGVSSARNFGMDEARGEYLGFVDPDDWVSPHYLEWMVEAMQEQGVRMALVDFLDVQEGEEKTFEEYPTRPEAKKITTEHYPQAGRSMGGHAWRTLYHRSVVEKLRFDQSLHYAEDILFFTQAAAEVGSYAYLDVPLYYYLKRKGSAMEQDFTMKQYDEVTGWKKAFAAVEKGPKTMRDSVETRLLVACAHVYYRMENSPYADEALLKELCEETRQHRKLWWKLPNRNLREKGKVLMLLWFPSLGRGLWMLAKRLQKRDR